MPRSLGVFFACICVLCGLFGCTQRAEPPFSLKQVTYAALPDWQKEDMNDVLVAMQRNCQALRSKPEWKNVCTQVSNFKGSSAKQIRKLIENNMTPYAVYANGSDEGMFTGYYEASLNGSLQKDEKNTYPIYGLPKDIVTLDTHSICQPGYDKGTITGRIEKGRFVPYYTRADIHEDSIDAPVLLWVESPVDAFILHIQGSGRVQTPDGVFHVGYAGNNGHDFVGIGSIMEKEGLLQPGQASMPHIRQFLHANPQRAKQLMNQNPRYIFFKMLEKNDGPIGAFGVPLTAKRSMAVDTNFVPLGSLLYLDTFTPDGKPLRRLVAAQDKGNAIKGAVRGDFFWGYGDEAFENAGRMKSKGRYFILYPKNVPVPTVIGK